MKDVSCFLKVAVNPHDEMAFKRILKLLAGIGAKTADKLWGKFHPVLADGKPLLLTSEAIPKKAVDDWKKAAQVLNQLRQMEPKRAAEMIEQVVEGFYASYLKVKYPNARTREEDLHQLASFAMQFETIDDFLSQLALLTNLEAEDASLLTFERAGIRAPQHCSSGEGAGMARRVRDRLVRRHVPARPFARQSGR